MDNTQQKLIRLNLGCGRKLLPLADGWVNSDISAPPEVVMDSVAEVSKVPFDSDEITEKTRTVFHAADIKNMNFIQSGSIAEVHMYHVIEHFEVSELPRVFEEIRRILHPEIGCLVLEQPNVIKCAKNLLQIETTKDPKIWHNLGLQGFYGDIEPGNVHSIHKWGWYPESLAEVLIKNGFKHVVQQDAMTHAKNLRDFRLVAFINKVPEGLKPYADRPPASAEQQVAQAMKTTGIGVNNPMSGKSEPLVVTPMDSVASQNLLENIQKNINAISKWLKRAKTHNKTAIIASAGPSLRKHLPELKRRQQEGAIIFCVKHSLPILVEAGINPEFCVILDPRPLDGVSTHGIIRKELFLTIPQETTLLVAEVCRRRASIPRVLY